MDLNDTGARYSAVTIEIIIICVPEAQTSDLLIAIAYGCDTASLDSNGATFPLV